MEFQKRYKFMDSLPFIIMLSILLVGISAMIVFLLVYGLQQGQISATIITVVTIFVIFFIVLLSITLILSTSVIIDEEKIVFKGLRGAIVSYNINDIYKIETKQGPKGVLLFEIHGNTPQVHFRKSIYHRDMISLIVTDKSKKVLQHFINNPEVWQTEI